MYRSFSNGILFQASSSNNDNEEIVNGEGSNDENFNDKAKIFDELSKDLFGGNPTKFDIDNFSNPFQAGIDLNVGKRSLYNDDELMNILSTHQKLSDEILGFSDDATSSSSMIKDNENSDVPFSLHDLVMKTISAEERKDENSTKAISSDLKKKSEGIRAIASDIDGTILSSDQSVHPITRDYIYQAIEKSLSDTSPSFYFFPATGKSRKGALSSLGMDISSRLIEANLPGVFLQGLFCVDGKNNILFEKKLTKDAIHQVEEIVKKEQLSIVGYDGDFLCTIEQTELVKHLHTHYGEPLPLLLDGNRSLSEHPSSLHKILIMDDDTKKLANVIRPQLEALANQFDITVTQAIPTMLEVLPSGCSKALGVRKVCEAMDIDIETELLALGDAENDVDMLKEACIGVAVGNGCDIAKNAADYTMDETNDDGAAGIAMRKFYFETND